MNKKACAILCAAALMFTSAALGEGVEIDGEIRAARVLTIEAPYTGKVGDFTIEAGDALKAGAPLFELETVKLYAEMDGTIKGVFAQPGDSAAAVQARYGALMNLEQELLYTADCTTSGASGKDNKVVHPGEMVYLVSESSSTREGKGRITNITGTAYTVEITDDGDLRVGDVVKVYRDADYDECVGTGVVGRLDPVKVTAEGHVLRVCVSEGQTVKRGDLLAEIVPDALEGMRGGSSIVTMPEDGVLLSVQAQSGAQAAKDAALATYCPDGELELVCAVDEDDLPMLKVGARMSVTLDAYPDEVLDGTVKKIAFVADESGDYAVTIALSDPGNARIGMSATAK